MTTARSSGRSRRLAVAAFILLLAAAEVSAHRRDEYLQATRISIEPDRVALELDLTPGMALADAVIAEIDRDGNGRISNDEARAYAEVVRRDLTLAVDGRPMSTTLVEDGASDVETLRNGEGALRFRWVAETPSLAEGRHTLVFRNAHHTEIGVYLANALVPGSDRVTIGSQERDVAQRELRVAYVLRDSQATRVTGAAGVGLVGVALALVSVRRRRRPSTRPTDV